MRDKNVYRVTLIGDEYISNFLASYSVKTQKQMLDFLLTLNDSDNVSVMYKNRANAHKILLDDYNLVIRATEELPLKGSKKPTFDGTETILYRYKNRISYDISKYARIDISEVQGSENVSNIFRKYPTYELEIEFTDQKLKNSDFYHVLYDTLCVVQESDLPVSKKEADEIMRQYKSILGLKYLILETRNVISIDFPHLVNFIPNKYAVTDKPDGERFFMVILDIGIYLISINFRIKKIDISINNNAKNIILDGELMKIKGKRVFLAFDIVHGNDIDYRTGEDNNLTTRLDALYNTVSKCFGTVDNVANYIDKNTDMELDLIRKFYEKELKRYWTAMTKHIENNKNDTIVIPKYYFVPYGVESSEVFMYASLLRELYVYDKIVPYMLDGIIYTPINSPYIIKASMNNLDSVPLEYKWKDATMNSIDFYVIFQKEQNGDDVIFYDDDGEQYKICLLHVGNIRGTEEIPIFFKIANIAQIAYVKIIDGEARDSKGDIISDHSVIEFIYDTNKNNADNGYKWIPIRTRHDKTESVIRYRKRYGNNLITANRIWKTIINPVTEAHIDALSDPATFSKEISRLRSMINAKPNSDVYYQKITNDATEMRRFNNYIKSSMITMYCKGNPSVLDIGCGRGGVISKFISAGISNYVGVDIDNSGLFVSKDSALARYKKKKRQSKNVPEMKFINADARGLLTVAAQEHILPNMTLENKKMIRSLLSGAKKYGLINCQFTIHYYLMNDVSWNNFLANINNHLDTDGYLLITCFDGDFLYERLLNKNRLTIDYIDDKGQKHVFADIVKMYDDSCQKTIGVGIDLYNSLISEPDTYIREYLVFSSFIKEEFQKKCKLQLVETDTFFNLFNLYKDYFTEMSEVKKCEPHLNDVRKFYQILDKKYQNLYSADVVNTTFASFKFAMLNRYFVFRKTFNNVTKPSHIVGVNHVIDVGKVLTPHFNMKGLIIDPGKKSRDANKIYTAFRQAHRETRPSVYVIEHTVPIQKITDNEYTYNKFKFRNTKKGTDGKILLLYKSPQDYYYPIYHEYDGHKKKYLFEYGQVVDELDAMVKLTNRFK